MLDSKVEMKLLVILIIRSILFVINSETSGSIMRNLIFLVIVLVSCQSQPEKLELHIGNEYCECLKEKLKFPDCVANPDNKFVGECMSEITENHFKKIMSMSLTMDSIAFKNYEYNLPIRINERIFLDCYDACYCLVNEKFNKDHIYALLTNYREFIDLDKTSYCIEDQAMEYLCTGGMLDAKNYDQLYSKKMKSITRLCVLNNTIKEFPQYSTQEEAVTACIKLVSNDQHLQNIDLEKYCSCLTTDEVNPKEYIEIIIDRVINSSYYLSDCYEQAKKIKVQ